MEIKVLGKEIKVTEAINDYIEKKLDRIDKYFENSEAEVTIRAEKNEQIAEVVVMANGDRFAAAAEEKDLYASIDKVIDILEGQIRKAKTKREKMLKEGSLKDMNQVSYERKEISNEILKYGYYEIKPLAPEDAMLELQERPTHNFLPFINVETNKVCVIYKLKDGKNFGIVEPEA
jgi:putative sigma-54 modulation protein